MHEAKTNLSQLLRRVESGESVVIKRGQQPVAVLSAYDANTHRRAIWGQLPGRIHDDFDELPAGFADYVSASPGQP